MSHNIITVTGLVATTPRYVATSSGETIISFRLASSERRYDRNENRWIDGQTNWYTVSAFRALASNASESIKKGDRIIVSGRLQIRDWENTDRSGTTVEIVADVIGHDLSFGTATYTRTITTLAPEGN